MSGGRVILSAYYFPPENTSGVQRASRFHRYLPEHEWQVYPLCARPEQESGLLPGVRYVPDDATRAAGAGRGEKLARWAERILPYHERAPWAAHAVAAGEQILREHGRCSIISTSPPVGSHLVAWRLKQKHGIPWVADFRDPILGNPGRPRKWARAYDAWLQERIVANADAVVCVTDAVAAEWKKRYPSHAAKIHVIWNGFDPAAGFGPKPIPPRSKRVLLHAGVLYRQRHPKSLLNSLDRLVQSGRLSPDRFTLRFLGWLQGEEEFFSIPAVQRLREAGCLDIAGNLPRAEAMDEIATADWLFLIDIVNLDGSGYTVPAKIFDYLLTGRPVLCMTDPGSPVDRILKGSGVPFECVYHEDPEPTIDEKVCRLLTGTPETVRPSEWFFSEFDGARQAGKLAAILNSLG
jgi:glycosyltransferase involved in cell wall biosynthesis